MTEQTSFPRPSLSRAPSVTSIASSSTSRSSSRPAPPPKPSHLSVSVTGTLNSAALREYVRAQSTGGSFSSQHSRSSTRSDDEGEGDEDWGTAKAFQPPSLPQQHSGSGKTPLRDIWNVDVRLPMTSEPEPIVQLSEDPLTEAHEPHSRYVSSASTIKASRQNRALTSSQQLVEAEEDEAAIEAESPGRSPTAQGQSSITSEAPTSLRLHEDDDPEARGHHRRDDTSIATIRPPAKTTNPPAHNPPADLYPATTYTPRLSRLSQLLGRSESEDRHSPLPGLPRFSRASSYGILAIDGERSREPSILSARGSTTFAKWDMQYADGRAPPDLARSPLEVTASQPQDVIPEVAKDSEDPNGSPHTDDAMAAEKPETTALPAPSDSPPLAKVSANASLDTTPTPVPPRPKMARALYAIHGESAFNELSLAAGQSFEIVNEELQGGWCLALVKDDSTDSGWRRGLVPRGWYAIEREMAPPPPPQPSEAEVLERRKNQDEPYLAPVTVKASNINAEAEKQPALFIEDPEVEAQPSTDSSAFIASHEGNASSAVPSVSQFLNHGSSSTGQSPLQGESPDRAPKNGTATSLKRQTRATAALSQLMSPSLSAQGSTLASGAGSLGATSKLLSPPGASRSRKRSNPAQLVMSPSSHVAQVVDETRPGLPAPSTSPLTPTTIDDEPAKEISPHPSSPGPLQATPASPPASDSFQAFHSIEASTADAPLPAIAHSQIIPFSRRLNRFSPFVTSGAEPYLLSREVEHVPAKAGADRSLRRTFDAGTGEGSDTHEIAIEANGELRWREELNLFWVEIHDPAYVEVNASKGWLRLNAEGVVVFQVTTRTVEGDLATYRAFDRYDSAQKPPATGLSAASAHCLPPLDPVLPPSGPSSAHTVPRRYKHFVQLAECLESKYPLLAATAIPPLPAKSHSRRFDAEFIELRRKELSNWLERIVRHPILRKDEALVAFLLSGSSPSETLQDGEEDKYQDFEQWFSARQPSERARQREQAQPLAPGALFFARTFHPEFAVDQDDFDIEAKRCEAWFRSVEGQITGSGSAKKNPEPLLDAFKGMRQDLVATSESYRQFARSLLRLTTGVGDSAEDLKAHGHVMGPRSTVRNDGGVWCWREGCQECAALTHSLQMTSDTLQEIADLHEQQARYHLYPTHERIWNVSRPHATNQALFETHHATLAKYDLARAADSSALAHDPVVAAAAQSSSGPLPVDVAEHLAGKAETVLNVTMAEIDHQHASKVSDWTKIGKDLLDEQIGFYEEVLGKLYEARKTYAPSEWNRVAEGSAATAQQGDLNQGQVGLNPSPYLSELQTARAAPPPPLAHPSTQLIRAGAVESVLLRPVGLAGEVLIGMLGGKGGRADARRAFSNAGSASAGSSQPQSQPWTGSGHSMGRSFSSSSAVHSRPGS